MYNIQSTNINANTIYTINTVFVKLNIWKLLYSNVNTKMSNSSLRETLSHI